MTARAASSRQVRVITQGARYQDAGQPPAVAMFCPGVEEHVRHEGSSRPARIVQDVGVRMLSERPRRGFGELVDRRAGGVQLGDQSRGFMPQDLLDKRRLIQVAAAR
ncbi:hypothetical protein [Streptomyces sp. NBC_01613]|uniref:hypothetical protein n=1 Tax=Streptomyces sp. NBC_01613 TaxID=2975896 RepID=UPI003863DA5A